MNKPEPKVASESQKKLFFALCNEAGHDSEKAKDRAKEKFGLQHFSEITSEQISQLIDKFQSEIEFAQPTEVKPKEYSYKFTAVLTLTTPKEQSFATKTAGALRIKQKIEELYRNASDLKVEVKAEE